MNVLEKIDYITNWIKTYTETNGISSLVVGVSGGIDSAVVSTLCAKTGLPTYAISMPIKTKIPMQAIGASHGDWLLENYNNVFFKIKDLSHVFLAFEDRFEDMQNDLAFANTRARLRMTALYQVSQVHNGIVVGTGNKVEDFGVGFYTKYGDGGVDISPIADCMKSEVWDMGRELGINQEIIDAAPTDGLWEDDRTDEGQLGMTYPELEAAMLRTGPLENIDKFKEIQRKNLHKMKPIPICFMS